MQVTRPADIGALVKDYRRARKLRQADLAKQLHVSPKWLSQFENGKPTVQIGLALRVLLQIGIVLVAQAPPGRTAGKRSRPRLSIDDIVDG